MGALDLSLLRWINHWPEGQAGFWQYLSESLQYPATKIVLGAILLGMLIRGPKTRLAVFLALIAFPLANELTDVIKNLWAMPRPYQAPAVADLIVRCGLSENPGTASAHSANNAAIALVFAGRLKWWGVPWVVLAILVGISRVYVGAHYPSQVLLGWTCGAAVGAIVLWVTHRIETRASTVMEKNDGVTTA